jgi:hypothetical protein
LTHWQPGRSISAGVLAQSGVTPVRTLEHSLVISLKNVCYLLGVKDSRMFLLGWPGFGIRLCIANTRKAHALDYLDWDVIVMY